MILTDLGYVALLLAFCLAAFVLVVGSVGAAKGLRPFVLSARNALLANALLLTVASALLVNALLTRDFRLRYVAETSSRDMSAGYLVTSFWGGQAGSLLFWAWTLTLFSAVAVLHGQRRYPDLTRWVAPVLAAVQFFFLLILSFLTNPFERLQVPELDGRGLNPLLQDPGMRIHPPMLLMGYMSFTIPFAYAIAALLAGRLGREWLGAIRRWMLIGWGIQGTGLLLGAWWAYHVLGWGGYWGWDPVENAALMPWLTATAFLHSTMVQERRGMLKVWNLGLVMLTFALAIFGTFVVRSGVLSSVHAFATSTIGPFFFGFLGITIISSVALIFFRLPRLQTEGRFDSVLSRESSFLVNNLLIVGITAATFWGSIFPLISEVFRGRKVAVGPPFYQQVNGPLLLALLLLMGIGPMLAWRRSAPAALWRNLRWPLALGGLLGTVLVAVGVREPLALLAYAAVAFVFGTIWLEFYRGTRLRVRNTGEPFPVALLNLVSRGRRRYGGYIVHLAMLLVALGVISSGFFQSEAAGVVKDGQSLSVAGYSLTNKGLFQYERPGQQIAFAEMELSRNGKPLGVIRPERRIFRNWENQPVTGVAVQTLLPGFDDVYVMMSSIDENGVAAFRVYVNPMVTMVWLGGLLFVLGTLLAAWPEGRRRDVAVRAPQREVALGEA